MSFPRYPKYKDSGFDWLGEVPDDWSVAPLKRCFRIVGGSTPASGDESLWDGDVPWATPSDLSGLGSLYVDTTQRTITERGLASCGTSLVPAGTIVLSTRAPIGSLAIATRELCTNQGCKSLVPMGETDSRFYAYVLSVSTEQLTVRGKGTTFLELSSFELGAFSLPSPPPATQQAIAAFLDRETAKIDALIAEQQRLIELLQEKRQAVISHAVTKGLNPDAPMKDSGIEWLGEVPEHWGVTRLSRYAVVGNGSTPSRENEDYWRDGDIPWLSSGEVNQIHVTVASEFITAKALKECSLTMLPTGTVLVGMVGQGKTRGLSALLRIEAAINQNVAGIVPAPLLKPEYLHFVFQAMYEYLREYGRGGNQAALNCDILSAAIIPLPPLDEQSDICKGLSNACYQQDLLLAETQKAIAILRERRSALISAAVTGQIDVRNLAASEAA